ncbi:MAG: hypothetical protein LWY06_03710 [Firmicutes bacterium]|nr:hypothetical protein [Bacillota bacterium]
MCRINLKGDSMNAGNKTWGIIYIILGVVILGIGAAGFAGFLFMSISDLSGSMVRFKAPGSIEINAEKPCRYGVYIENRSTFNGRVYNINSGYEDIGIKVTDKKTGKEIKTETTNVRETYNIGSNTGYLRWNFNADVPGTYLIEAEYPESQGPDIILAVGSNFFGKVLKTVLIGLVILFGVIICSGALMFIGAAKLNRAGRGMI